MITESQIPVNDNTTKQFLSVGQSGVAKSAPIDLRINRASTPLQESASVLRLDSEPKSSSNSESVNTENKISESSEDIVRRFDRDSFKFLHHGNCTQMPKLRIRASLMWNHCEQCGAVEIIGNTDY